MEESSLKKQSFGDSLKNLIPSPAAGPDAGPDAGPGPDAAPGPDLGSGMDSASSQSGFKDFSSASVVEGSKDFLESNSWVAKIAFLLMVIIGFAVLFRLMVALITWLFSPGGKVVLVDGYINGSDSCCACADVETEGTGVLSITYGNIFIHFLGVAVQA
jgi:hypothetical protein